MLLGSTCLGSAAAQGQDATWEGPFFLGNNIPT